MFQDEAMVNQVLNYSKVLVDQIEKEKGIHYSLQEKSKQYLIFAGMLSYYGLESVSVIYKAFQSMNFHILNLSTYDILLKNFPGASQRDLEISQHGGGSFVCPKYISSKGKFQRNYDLFISSISFPASVEMLEVSTHEVNHIVNSVNKEIVNIYGQNYLRIGIRVFETDGKSKNAMLEEGLNVLQSFEIMKEIINFTNFKIYDPIIAAALENISFARGQVKTPIGYPSIVTEIKPLYENPVLHHVFKEGRKEGELSFIIEEVDKRAGKGTFYALSDSLDNMFYRNHSEYDFFVNQAKTHELVQKVLRK